MGDGERERVATLTASGLGVLGGGLAVLLSCFTWELRYKCYIGDEVDIADMGGMYRYSNFCPIPRSER